MITVFFIVCLFWVQRYCFLINIETHCISTSLNDQPRLYGHDRWLRPLLLIIAAAVTWHILSFNTLKREQKLRAESDFSLSLPTGFLIYNLLWQ
jgi:hypothetical protein